MLKSYLFPKWAFIWFHYFYICEIANFNQRCIDTKTAERLPKNFMILIFNVIGGPIE